jgi:type VI secretion system protein ImpF
MPAPGSNETPLQPSLLDRLLDDDPAVQQEPVWQQGAGFAGLRQSVRRDLEDLLNARRPLSAATERFAELRGSLAEYGLPDLQSLTIRIDHDHSRFCRLVEELIRDFEPRLRGVRVIPAVRPELGPTGERSLAFDIEAVLAVDPVSEPVFFSAKLHSGRGDFDVEARR